MGLLYRKFIEDNFLIDEPETGKLVPFKFRQVQADYYNKLVREYDIENKGLTAAVREIILKARREGFSSLILGLFAADDLTQENPTETLVISYRDDATDTFRKRYRLFVTSAYALQSGYKAEDIQKNPNVLDEMARVYLSVDASDIEIKENKAHFYCGTASARVGGRGGVLQKLLFSEEAFYPDSEKMTSTEIVDGTLRQVDINSGWVFRESTANGYGNYYEKTWTLSVGGETRFRPRFYGWREMYTQKEYDLIASEFTDKHTLRQEYPETPEEAFIASGSSYFDNDLIMAYIKKAPNPLWTGTITMKCDHQIECRSLAGCDFKHPEVNLEDFISRGDESDGAIEFKVWERPLPYHSYIISADVAEGVDGDNSVAKVIDNRTLKTVAKWKSKLCPPDRFAIVCFALGAWYNFAYAGIEANKDGLWVNAEMFKMGYPNLYYREQIDDITKQVSRKHGFLTTERTRPYILSELQKVLKQHPEAWNDKDFLRECLVFVRNKVGRPEAMSGKHDDEIFATAIGLEIRRNAPEAFPEPKQVPQDGQSYVIARLERIKADKRKSAVPTQKDYL